MVATSQHSPRLIRRAEVTRLTGLGRSAIYQKIASGEFPTPIRLGARAVAWQEHEVVRWIANRVSLSRGGRQ